MKGLKWLLPGLALLLVPATLEARPPVGQPAAAGARANVPDLGTVFDANELLMFVTNRGSWAYDQLIGDAGLEWPQGTGRHTVFASGLWLGAKVNGVTRLAVGAFAQEYAAGPMDAGTGQAVDPDEIDPKWKVLKLNSDDDAGSNPDYAAWRDLAAELGDDGPPVDENGDPLVLGEQSLWCVYNDAVAGKHTVGGGQTDPLGVEVRQTTFGFNRPGALGKTVFLDFEIENKGSNLLEEMYISLWFDPDLGGFTDDLVGADTTLSLGFCYNATNTDQQYGANPPTLGCDFFLGPLVGGVPLGMTSFNKYINGTDPSSAAETYNYMQGLDASGAPQFCGATPTRFVLTGDPVAGTSCLDSDPADRRFMMTTGPITMSPGETQRIVAAIIVGGEQGAGNRLSNINLLKFYDTIAQDAFDRDFDVPDAPPRPVLTVRPLDRAILLTWDRRSQLEYDEPGYSFEGYNIYQGASRSGPFTRIATYDVVNGQQDVYDDIFDPDVGAIQNVVVQQGLDTGVRHRILLDQDAVRGGPLRNGTNYFISVTAYSLNPGAVPSQRALENPFSAITVIPQRPVAGVDFESAAATAATGLGPSTDQVLVEVVNPGAVLDADYRVSFTGVTPFNVEIDGVTYPVDNVWSLENLTSGQTLLEDQVNKTGNNDYVVTEGIQVNLIGGYLPIGVARVEYIDSGPNPPAFGAVNWGGSFFGGGFDYGCHWTGSSIVHNTDELGSCLGATVAPDSFRTVEIRFGVTQKGYRYFRRELDGGGSPPGGRLYSYQDYADVPFQVWAVDTDGNDVAQLQVMFIERQVVDEDQVPLPTQPATQDGTWGPSDEGAGGREYLAILADHYTSDIPDPQYEMDNLFFSGSVPTIYGGWIRKLDATSVADPGDLIRFVRVRPATEADGDEYLFSTSAATGVSNGMVVGDAGAARSSNALEQIRAVPNPYLTRSTYELDQFNRVLKFTNLPATCTIRLFTLAGDLVRTLEKDDPSTSILEWDLENRFGLPVGSGIYVYHVEAPGIGGTHGKLAVIMEEERLEDF